MNEQNQPVKISETHPVTRNEASIAFAVQHYTGPIPSAEQMELYARIDVTLPQQIFDLAKMEQTRRWEEVARESELRNRDFDLLETQEKHAYQTLTTNAQNIARGQWFAFIVCLVCLFAVVVCVVLNQPWPAGIIGTTGIAAIVVAFIRSSIIVNQRK